jgi:hypothetical protein
VTIPALIPVELGEQKWRGNVMVCFCGRSVYFAFDHLGRTVQKCDCGYSELVARRVLPEEERPKTAKRVFAKKGIWKRSRQTHCATHGPLTAKDLVSNGHRDRCGACARAAARRQWRKRKEQASA